MKTSKALVSLMIAAFSLNAIQVKAQKRPLSQILKLPPWL